MKLRPQMLLFKKNQHSINYIWATYGVKIYRQHAGQAITFFHVEIVPLPGIICTYDVTNSSGSQHQTHIRLDGDAAMLK